METHTYFEMDYEEFDKLVRKHFDHPALKEYEFIADEEVNNYSHKAFTGIDGFEKEEMDPYDKESMKDPSQNQFMAALLLQDMCQRGIIPKGDYLIDVFW